MQSVPTMLNVPALLTVLMFLCILPTDINECSSNTHSCDAHANCTNNIGSFDCRCISGWQGDGQTCQGNKLNEFSLILHYHITGSFERW